MVLVFLVIEPNFNMKTRLHASIIMIGKLSDISFNYKLLTHLGILSLKYVVALQHDRHVSNLSPSCLKSEKSESVYHEHFSHLCHIFPQTAVATREMFTQNVRRRQKRILRKELPNRCPLPKYK
jgi:hypothetical protein